MRDFLRKLFIVDFVNNVRSFVNHAIFVNCAIRCDLRVIVQNCNIAQYAIFQK